MDLLTGQKTINAQYYSTLLTEKVKPAIRSKRRKLQDSLCFLQDNARPHTAALTLETTETEVGCTASSTEVLTWLIRLPVVWNAEGDFRGARISETMMRPLQLCKV
jgi:hypothetical protein